MTEPTGSRSERVSIDDTVLPIYKTLTDSSDAEQAPFKTMKDVFMLAVIIGYRQGTRRPVPTGAKTTIRKEVFSENDIHLLKAIAIATTGNVEVLLHQGDILTIAEEYAQAGIHEVKAELLDQVGRPLWNVVGLLQ